MKTITHILITIAKLKFFSFVNVVSIHNRTFVNRAIENLIENFLKNNE